MTKLVVTLEQGDFPTMDRYENGMKVGSRKISLEALLRSFIEDASLDLIFDILINQRNDDLDEYFEGLSDMTDNGLHFLVSLFNKIPDSLFNRDKFSDIAQLVLENACDEALSVDQLTPVLSTWVNKVKCVPCKNEYVVLYKDLLQYFLGTTNSEHLKFQKELLKTIYKYMKGLKEKNEIDNWVAMHVEHLPSSMLIEALQAKNVNNKVIHGFSSVPKNAAFVATTSVGTTYFYDIPKTKMRVKFQDVAFDNVGHPRLLFAISTVNNKTKEIRLCAIKGKNELTLETPLFHYPYSNVYSNGRVCWSGWDNLPIDQMPMMFLSTSNNSHLNSETLSLFKKYQNKNYPDKVLMPMSQQIEDWC
ncbi:hypothetical protein ACOMCU_22540 [Lysinibacillus sp. UGB7]|uniref:hypothetical protein n=1 Tax=Lysinibacillus sp. UGB7 TaxID=3411039 RepID=UPI003B785958